MVNFFKSQKLLLSAMLVFVWLVFIFTSMHIQYQTIDDYFMSMFASGAFGEFSPFLVNIHNILGLPLAFLYKSAIFVPWYPLFFAAIIYISITVIVYVMFCRFKYFRVGFFVLLAIGAMIFPDNFQFTIISYLCIIAGTVLWINAPYSPNMRFQNIAAALLILIGGLIRSQCLYTALSFVISLLAVDFIISKISKKNAIGLSNLKQTALILLAFFVPILLWQLQYSRYSDFYSLKDRTVATDYNIIPAELAEKIYSSATWSENDYKMMLSYHYDDNYFSKDMYKKLVDAKKTYLLNRDNQISKTIDRLSNSYGNIITLVVLCILLCFFEKRLIPYGAVLFLIPVSINILLSYLDRSLDRVIIPQYITSIILMLLIYGLFGSRQNRIDRPSERKDSKIDSKNRLIAVISSLALIALIFIYQGMVKRSQYYDISKYKEYRALLDYTFNHKNNCYIYDTFSLRNEAYGIFEVQRFNQFGNCIPSGDWWSHLDLNSNNKKNNGIDGIFKAIVEKDNVFYITAVSNEDFRVKENQPPGEEKAQQICVFLKERYNITSKPKQIDSFGGAGNDIYAVYKLEKQ